MANTFELIASSTVGAGGTSSIVFGSIPATYTDLVVMCSLRNTGTADQLRLSLNSSTANFSNRLLYGSGSTAGSLSNGGNENLISWIDSTNETANTFANISFYIPNYASSNYKSVSTDGVQENNATAALASMTATLWSVTTAINAVTLLPTANNFAQYSTAYLYGVKNA